MLPLKLLQPTFMTTYFSAVQQRVLKFVWIPVLIYLAFYLLGDIHQQKLFKEHFNGTDHLSTVLLFLPFVFAVGYEFLMRNKYKEAIFVMLTATAGEALILLELFYRGKSLRTTYGLDTFSLSLCSNFLILTVRAYLIGGPRLLQRALVGLVITYFTSALASHIFSFMNPFYNLGFWVREVISLPFRILSPILYFTGLFLADNLVAEDGYLEKLKSKLERISAKEYLVLYFFLAIVCFFGGTAFSTNLSMFINKIDGHKTYLTDYYPFHILVIFLLGYGTACAAAGYLLRNIIISRMNTIGSDNGWLYVLHYSFLLNIIPLIVWSNAASVHKTEEDNATFYLTKVPSSVGMVIMCLGAICAFVTGFYLLSALGRYSSTGGYAIGFAALCIFSSMMHLMLQKFKAAVYWLLTLNGIAILLFVIFAGGDGIYAGTMLMSVYLSFFVMMEVFHPSLDKYQLPGEELLIDKNPGEIIL